MFSSQILGIKEFCNIIGSEVVNWNWLSDLVLFESRDNTTAMLNGIPVDRSLPVVACKEVPKDIDSIKRS